MLLAGNEAHAHAKAQAQVYADTPRTTTIGQPMNMTLSSPLSLGASITRDAPKKMNSFRRVMQSDVPQMREASLARFLEKRKERYHTIVCDSFQVCDRLFDLKSQRSKLLIEPFSC
ncbi:hypothetical protein R6Q57_015161 [Mikania cordata]